MPSFDIVSKADQHEVQNAFDQAVRELTQRFDFRGCDATLERTDKGFALKANSEAKVNAIYEVLQDKFVKRKLSLKYLDKKDAEPAGGQMWRMTVELKEGVDKDNAKNMVQVIKDDKKLKVTPSIQGDAVRITGKKKDDLQEVMAMLRQKDFSIDISFNNFRD